jgi:hypothetical protein
MSPLAAWDRIGQRQIAWAELMFACKHIRSKIGLRPQGHDPSHRQDPEGGGEPGRQQRCPKPSEMTTNVRRTRRESSSIDSSPEKVPRVWDYHADGVAIDDVAARGRAPWTQSRRAPRPAVFCRGRSPHRAVVGNQTHRDAGRGADPEPIMKYVEHEEADARHEATSGRVYRQRGKRS